MKLYVDDIRTPTDDSWHICRSVLSAIRALDMFWETIEEVSLDHDISHQIVMGGMSRPYACDETFEAVARYMRLLGSLHPTFFRPKVHIHTSNPIGAERMKEILFDFEVDIILSRGANRLETIL